MLVGVRWNFYGICVAYVSGRAVSGNSGYGDRDGGTRIGAGLSDYSFDAPGVNCVFRRDDPDDRSALAGSGSARNSGIGGDSRVAMVEAGRVRDYGDLRDAAGVGEGYRILPESVLSDQGDSTGSGRLTCSGFPACCLCGRRDWQAGSGEGGRVHVSGSVVGDYVGGAVDCILREASQRQHSSGGERECPDGYVGRGKKSE